MPIWSDLKHYLESSYSSCRAVVEFDHIVSFAQVWIPPEGTDDICYAVADSEGATEETPKSEISSETLHHYSSFVWHKLRYSEALAPDERSHLPTEYIRPRFQTTSFENRAGSYRTQRDASLDEVSHYKRVFIWGGAGAGKTSLTRWLTIANLEKAAKNPDFATIPVYCRLAGIDHGKSLWDTLLEYSQESGLPFENEVMIHLSESGRIQFLFDGLDEVPDSTRNDLFNEIRVLGNRFPLASILVTCRPAVYQHVSEEYKHFSLQPFNRAQIAEWCFKKLHDRTDRSWETFVNHLFNNRELLELASNPLLLNVVTHVYTRQDILPSNRALVVQTWLEALLNQWDHVRAVSRSTEYWASPRRRFDALYHTAYQLCRERSYSFSSQQFKEWEATQTDDLDAEKTLYSLSAHCGVLQKNKGDTWTFLHRALLEHCAAYYMVKGSEDLSKQFSQLLTDPLWQSIWLQACAISQDSTDLIALVIEQEKLDPLTKSTLIFRAFTQKIRCSKKVFSICRIYIEHCFNDIPMGPIRIQSSGRTGSYLCAYRIEHENIISPNKTELLFSLIHAAHGARGGDLNAEIKPNNPNDLLSVILEIGKFDGLLSIQQVDSNCLIIGIRHHENIPSKRS